MLLKILTEKNEKKKEKEERAPPPTQSHERPTRRCCVPIPNTHTTTKRSRQPEGAMDITNERSQKMQKDDDHAGMIAEKLLEGWTLLAEYCPMEGCLAPLMRSRDGRRYCVAHDMFVMSPEVGRCTLTPPDP
jgi:hypothetical protein